MANLNYLDFCRKHRKLLVVLTIFFLVSTLYSSQSVAVWVYSAQSNDIKYDVSHYDRYIIKFNEEPLSTFRQQFKDKIKNVFSHLTEKVVDKLLTQKVLQYKNRILSLHRKAKEDILKLVGSSSEEIFSGEFVVLFNGIAIKKVPDIILEKIRDLPYVKSIAPDYKIVATLDVSVPLIRADDVWELSVTGKDVSIAILDTGVDYTHPDLNDSYVRGYDFVNNDSCPIDDYGHGTHCAGIALGRGDESGYKYVGVAPDAKLYAYKVMDNKGEGTSSMLIKGIERAVDPDGDGDFSDHVDIISISAGSEEPGHPDDDLSVAADNAVEAGVVVVVAAGNDGNKGISSPGCARKVICVGATDKEDKVASFSSRGPTPIGTIKPDVVAPGVNIVAPLAAGTSFGSPVDEYYTSASGTSMATPHVAGTAALLLQMHPDWTPEEVKMALRNTAVCLGKTYSLTAQGYGRIDALEAVTLPGAPPISILETSGEIDRGLVDIYGTASADDFQNYSLYYRQDGDWIKLYNRSSEVIDNVLFIWDTRSLDGGNYELKLEVRSPNQTSVDIIFITLKHREDELLIESPDSVDEFRRFTVNVKDINGMPRRAWVLFTLPYHRPRLRYGSSVAFRAPLILNWRIESLEGKITVFKIFGDYSGGEKRITVINNKLISMLEVISSTFLVAH